jgi:hypothetical protein
MMKILSYLDAYSLLQVAQVNKVKAPWLNSSIRCILHETPLTFPTHSWSLGYPSTTLT